MVCVILQLQRSKHNNEWIYPAPSRLLGPAGQKVPPISFLLPFYGHSGLTNVGRAKP